MRATVYRRRELRSTSGARYGHKNHCITIISSRRWWPHMQYSCFSCLQTVPALPEKVLTLSNFLTSKLVKNGENVFHLNRCAKITWQRIKATRFFFLQRLKPQDFQGWGWIPYPKSEMTAVIEDIYSVDRYAVPSKWITCSNQSDSVNDGGEQQSEPKEQVRASESIYDGAV